MAQQNYFLFPIKCPGFMLFWDFLRRHLHFFLSFFLGDRRLWANIAQDLGSHDRRRRRSICVRTHVTRRVAYYACVYARRIFVFQLILKHTKPQTLLPALNSENKTEKGKRGKSRAAGFKKARIPYPYICSGKKLETRERISL